MQRALLIGQGHETKPLPNKLSNLVREYSIPDFSSSK